MAGGVTFSLEWAASQQSLGGVGSNKVITVPAGQEWVILSAHVVLVSTATVGNRQMEITMQDAAPTVFGRFLAGIVQAASLTRTYQFGPDLPDLTAFRDTDWISNPMPQFVLPAGYKINAKDNKAIDAAADTLTLRLNILSRPTA